MIVQPPDLYWWPSPWQWPFLDAPGPQVTGSIGALTPLAPDEPPPPPRAPIGFRSRRIDSPELCPAVALGAPRHELVREFIEGKAFCICGWRL
jgi:hypothetical protein